jgi:MYXO-CTERM domain-containing protein
VRGGIGPVRRLVATLGVAVAVVAIHPFNSSVDASAAGGQITVTETATTMTYGDLPPSFQGHLTPASDDPTAVYMMNFTVTVDSQSYEGSVSADNRGSYTLYVSIAPSPPLSVGPHSAVAKFQSTKYGLLTSAPVTFTVLKKTPTLSCYVVNVTNTYAPNTPLTITVDFANTAAPVDVQNGTFSVTFTGPRTFTTANLTANTGQVFASTPSATGLYRMGCVFSGTASFNPAVGQMGVPNIIVSTNSPVGRIALYTNPTPVTQGVMTSWKVVVSARSGLPTPTGNIAIRIGSSYTKVIPLEAGGTVTFQAVAPGLGPSSVITVWYYGDPVYAASSADFPLTTPLITADAAPSARTTVSNAASAAATPTPITTPGPTAVESPSSSPQAIALPSASHRFDPSLASSTGHSNPGGMGVPYLVGALAALTLVGLGAGLAWRQRRRR